MNVQIRLFGALREADERGYIELEMPDRSTIGALREALMRHLNESGSPIRPGLIERSAFASDDEILGNHREIPEDGQVAVLPPVSGG